MVDHCIFKNNRVNCKAGGNSITYLGGDSSSAIAPGYEKHTYTSTDTVAGSNFLVTLAASPPYFNVGEFIRFTSSTDPDLVDWHEIKEKISTTSFEIDTTGKTITGSNSGNISFQGHGVLSVSPGTKVIGGHFNCTTGEMIGVVCNSINAQISTSHTEDCFPGVLINANCCSVTGTTITGNGTSKTQGVEITAAARHTSLLGNSWVNLIDDVVTNGNDYVRMDGVEVVRAKSSNIIETIKDDNSDVRRFKQYDAQGIAISPSTGSTDAYLSLNGITADVSDDEWRIRARRGPDNLDIYSQTQGKVALTLSLNGYPVVPSYTVATLPIGVAGGMIYVSDATGASVTGSNCFYNGTSWIDVTTGIAVV